PVADPLWNHIQELSEVPPHLLKEIEHFFSIYKKLEEKDVEVDGWRGIEETLITIEESKDRYKKGLRSPYPMYE
ncbi:MAG: inorganic diphosphatase, partial [Thermodesulfobacteriota bacterium]